MQDAFISVNEVGHTKFQVYPNPAETEVTVKSINSSEPFEVELFDLLGNTVIEPYQASMQTTLDVRNVASGIYLLKTTVNGTSATSRISIQ